MSFAVGADAYDRFMGRYSALLAPQLADLGGVDSGQRVLDVGCGPGSLTSELVKRVGAAAVSAVDPSEQLASAARERHPGVDVRLAPAEDLPFADGEFDAALAQLVVHFMTDPVRGLAEMARVTRAGGVVSACVWDHAGEQTPLAPFWRAAHEVDPNLEDESELAGAHEGHLGELFRQVGLRNVEETALPIHVDHQTFEEWWEPFTLAVGPAGSYFAQLEPEQQRRIEERCRAEVGEPITITARAWAAKGTS